MKRFAVLLLAALFAIGIVGCAKKQAVDTSAPGPKDVTTSKSSAKDKTSEESGDKPESAKDNVKPTDETQGTKTSGDLPANPTAKDILTKAAATYASAKTLQMQGVLRVTQSMGKEKQSDERPIALDYKRPNSMRLEMGKGNESQISLMDGVNAYVYFPAEKMYMKRPAPKDAFGKRESIKDLSTQVLLAGNDISSIAKKAKLIGSEKINGVDTYIIEHTIESHGGGSTIKQKVWVGKSDYLIHQLQVIQTVTPKDLESFRQAQIKAMEQKAKESGQKMPSIENLPKITDSAVMTQTTTMKSIVANASVPDSKFKFTPPPGAKEFDPNAATPKPGSTPRPGIPPAPNNPLIPGE